MATTYTRSPIPTTGYTFVNGTPHSPCPVCRTATKSFDMAQARIGHMGVLFIPVVPHATDAAGHTVKRRVWIAKTRLANVCPACAERWAVMKRRDAKAFLPDERA